jgi:hypothetical protein
MLRVEQGKGQKCFAKHFCPCTNPLTRD